MSLTTKVTDEQDMKPRFQSISAGNLNKQTNTSLITELQHLEQYIS